jgi:hypothetical protein
MDPEKQSTTTFGAIVERKPKSTASSPALSQRSPIIPHLHLTSTHNYVEPPFGSPYEMPESPTEHHADLESGLYTHHPNLSVEDDFTNPRMLPIHTPPPIRSTPSPMLGEIMEEDEDEDSISNAPTITNYSPTHNGGLPTIVTTVPTTPSIPPSARTPSNHTPTPSTSEKTQVTTTTLSTKPTLTMWPTQREVKAKAKADKLARSRCNPIARLSKRTRVIVSVTIALTVIGAAVGIGVGISRAYGGSVWAGNGRTMPIGGSGPASE